jgi:hypothetical protein
MRKARTAQARGMSRVGAREPSRDAPREAGGRGGRIAQRGEHGAAAPAERGVLRRVDEVAPRPSLSGSAARRDAAPRRAGSTAAMKQANAAPRDAA